MLKILILSNTPWSTDNSFGNSFSNIFEGIEELQFANIYCQPGFPKNKINGRYFQITEESLIKNLIHRHLPSGIKVEKEGQFIKSSLAEKKILEHARKNRLQVYLWIRDLIWKIGRWKSNDLIKFIDDFKPDIIFQPLYYSNYLNDIVLFLKKRTRVPMFCYVSDDVYTLRQFSLSPLYWIDRLIKRRKIKKVVNLCEFMYVISYIQKKEYEKIFGKKCKILTKGADFTSQPVLKNTYSYPLKFVYTGNIGAGRWKSLAMIGKALKVINKNEVKVQLYIYTTTPLSYWMKRALKIPGSIIFKGGVPSEEIPRIQSEADVLVHVEPVSLKGRLLVSHSFSTKLVDYFHSARAIFAVGPRDIASIDYLIYNNAAIIASGKYEIYNQINGIVKNPALLTDYAVKAWECGKRNHQIYKIQEELYKDFEELVKK